MDNEDLLKLYSGLAMVGLLSSTFYKYNPTEIPATAVALAENLIKELESRNDRKDENNNP